MTETFLNELGKYKASIDKYIEQGALREFFGRYNANHVLNDYLDVFVEQSVGGKRIRAFLVKLGYELEGKVADESLIPATISYELFQTGVLAHDDIIDKSETRRHKPSMYMQLGGFHSGVSKAICLGDFGLITASDIISATDFDANLKLRASQHQNSVFIKTIAGEIKDFELSETKDFKEADIIDMYTLKTAWYSLTGPLLLGAILSDASQKTLENLEQFGVNAGIAFQIIDDVLGIYGDESMIGKSVKSDICEGKKTILLSHFLSEATDEDRQMLFNIYGMPYCSDEQLETVRWLFETYGTLEYAKEQSLNYTNNARDYLSKLEITEQSKQMLSELLEYLTSRNA